MDYQDRLNRIDRKRVGALNCRDAVLYYRYCEELGLPYDSLEAPDLFDEGLSLVEARQRSSNIYLGKKGKYTRNPCTET